MRFAEQQRKRVRELGPRVLDELGRYDWPGNVRELANVMEAEVSLAPPDVDVLDRLATRLVGRFRTAANVGSTGEWRAVGDARRASSSPSCRSPRSRSARSSTAIDRCGGSVSKAAEALGVSKVTIYAKLRSWGMHPKRSPRRDRRGTHERAVVEPAPTGDRGCAGVGSRDTPVPEASAREGLNGWVQDSNQKFWF